MIATKRKTTEKGKCGQWTLGSEVHLCQKPKRCRCKQVRKPGRASEALELSYGDGDSLAMYQLMDWASFSRNLSLFYPNDSAAPF